MGNSLHRIFLYIGTDLQLIKLYPWIMANTTTKLIKSGFFQRGNYQVKSSRKERFTLNHGLES
jgi:hypothetical protein